MSFSPKLHYPWLFAGTAAVAAAATIWWKSSSCDSRRSSTTASNPTPVDNVEERKVEVEQQHTDEASILSRLQLVLEESTGVAQQCKSEGNEALKAGLYESALKFYRQAIDLTLKAEEDIGLVEVSDIEAPIMGLREIRATCYGNSAMACLKLQQWQETILHCNQILDQELFSSTPKGLVSKALYRRGLARLELGDAATSLSDLRKAREEGAGSDSSVTTVMCQALLLLGFQALQNSSPSGDSFTEASKLANELNSKLLRADAMLGLAQVSAMSQRWTAAAKGFAMAADLADEAAKSKGLRTSDVKRLGLQQCYCLDRAAECCIATEDQDGVVSAKKLVSRVQTVDHPMKESELLGRSTVRLARSWMAVGDQNFKLGKWRDGAEAYRQSISTVEKIVSGRNSEVSTELTFEGPFGIPLGPILKSSLEEGAEILSDSLRMRGHALESLKSGVEARGCFDRAMQVAREYGDKQREAQALLGLGSRELAENNFALAEKHQRTALEMAKHLENNDILAAASGNLGKVLMLKGDYDQAVGLFEEAYNYRKQGTEAHGTAIQAMNLGNALMTKGSLKEADKWFQSALKVSMEANLPWVQAAALRSLVNMTCPDPEQLCAHVEHRNRLSEVLTQQLGFSPQDQCPISLEPFTSEVPVYVLECFHWISRPAFDDWSFKQDDSQFRCPVCRQQIVFPGQAANGVQNPN